MKLRTMADAIGFAHLMPARKAKAGARAEETPPGEQDPENPEKDPEDPENEDTEAEDVPADDPADDDEGDDEEMPGDGAAARARQRERHRCAAIFASPAAGLNPALAAELAFNTTLNRQAALALLQKGGRSNGLAGRLAGARNPDLGPSGKGEGGKAAVSTSWDASMKKARGA